MRRLNPGGLFRRDRGRVFARRDRPRRFRYGNETRSFLPERDRDPLAGLPLFQRNLRARRKRNRNGRFVRRRVRIEWDGVRAEVLLIAVGRNHCARRPGHGLPVADRDAPRDLRFPGADVQSLSPRRNLRACFVCRLRDRERDFDCHLSVFEPLFRGNRERYRPYRDRRNVQLELCRIGGCCDGELQCDESHSPFL